MAEQEYHYGDMTLVRPSRVSAAIAAKQLANRVAITEAHPAVKRYNELCNDLTDAEYKQVQANAPAKLWD